MDRGLFIVALAQCGSRRHRLAATILLAHGVLVVVPPASVRPLCIAVPQVTAALEEQVRRRYRRACESGQATYEFVDQEIPATDGRIRLSPTELAFESQL